MSRVPMLAAPLLLLTVSVISPINDSDEPAQRLADVFANEGRYAVAALLLLAGMMLLVPAVFGLRHLVPDDAWRPASIGATVAAVGFMLFTAATGALGLAPAAWATLPDAQQEGLLAAFTAMDEGKGPLAVVPVGPLLLIIGLTVLAVALWRHTDLPRAAVLALPLGWAVFLLTPINATRAIGSLLLLAGFAAAWRVRTPSPGSPSAAP